METFCEDDIVSFLPSPLHPLNVRYLHYCNLWKYCKKIIFRLLMCHTQEKSLSNALHTIQNRLRKMHKFTAEVQRKKLAHSYAYLFLKEIYLVWTNLWGSCNEYKEIIKIRVKCRLHRLLQITGARENDQRQETRRWLLPFITNDCYKW